MKTHLYELITPSDPITFRAESDKVAYVCAIMLSNGKAGVTREDGTDVPALLLFDPKPQETVAKYLGESLDNFVEQNKPAIKRCFGSFAYGNFSSRKMFDDAVEAITDAKKLKEFRRKHEDANRSSLSQWVATAWDYSERVAA